MNNKKISKQTIIGIILIAIFLPIIVVNMVIVIKGAVNPTKFPMVFGRAPLIVESDSMTIDRKARTGAFNKGDLIFIKKVNPETLKKDDIITYYSADGSIITHRIAEAPFYEEGKLTFNTKGDFNSPVVVSVPAEDVIGLYTGRIPKMGKVAMFLQTPWGVIVLLGFLGYDVYKKNTTKREIAKVIEDYDTALNSIDDNNSIGNTELPDIDAKPTENVTTNPNTNTTTGGNKTRKTQYKGYNVEGKIQIPAINLEYPILEKMSTQSLATSVVALYPSGDNINQPGNTVIVGHNYRNGLFFSNLKKLSVGDKVYITDYRGTSITYTIYNKFEASESDTSFYDRDTAGKAEITLSTCTDASNDQRTIIFAKQD